MKPAVESLTLLMVMAGSTLIARAGDVAMTDRYSLAGIPQIKTAPTIDGAVGKREWYGAALLPRLISTEEGGIAEQRSRVFVAYDAQTLYVAFQFDRPVNAVAPEASDEV